MVTASAVFPAGFMDATIKQKKSLRVESFSAEASDNVTAAYCGMRGRRGVGWGAEPWEGGKPSLAKPQQLLNGKIRHA